MTREGNFTRGDITFVDEVELFKGNENKISMIQTYSKKFHCIYLLHDYPFDVQVCISLNNLLLDWTHTREWLSIISMFLQICYMHIVLDEFDQETAILFPNMNDSKIESELELSLYTISGWKLVYFNDGNDSDTKYV